MGILLEDLTIAAGGSLAAVPIFWRGIDLASRRGHMELRPEDTFLQGRLAVRYRKARRWLRESPTTAEAERSPLGPWKSIVVLRNGLGAFGLLLLEGMILSLVIFGLIAGEPLTGTDRAFLGLGLGVSAACLVAAALLSWPICRPPRARHQLGRE